MNQETPVPWTRWSDPALLLLTALGLLLGGVSLGFGWERLAAAGWVAGSLVMALVLCVEIARRLLRGETGVDLVALLAIVAALSLGEWLVAAVVALMLASGRTLEFYTSRRAERELRALVDRAPRTAWLEDGEDLHQVPVDQVRIGQVILVRLGEVVPVDGRLLSHSASLDESALSGEPLPVTHTQGNTLRSGVVNLGEPIRIEASQTAAQSTYAGVVRLAEAARRSRAPFMRLADRYALLFVPATLLVAGLAWQLSGDSMRALAVLVVATPCPLILAVPIAIVSGISRAARRGILIKDGATLEALADVRQLFLDKTGTLTSGQVRLQSVEVTGGHETGQLLAWAASLAQASVHPISQAIVRAARQQRLSLQAPQAVEEDPGAGLAGRVGAHFVRLGTLSFALAGEGVGRWAASVLRKMDYAACGGSFVEVDGAPAGALLFTDQVRRETPRVVRRLRALGIERVVMLTGDRLETAEMIALAAGIDELRAGLSPSDKVYAVQEGRGSGPTLMVGDGINDAPALAAADVGVAMGAAGASASSEAAGVVLLIDRLDRLVEALEIARHTRTIARQGVMAGMGLSLLAMLVAAFGFLPALAGAVLQELIDVVVILYALRALGPMHGPTGPLSGDDLDRLQDEHEQLGQLLGRLQHWAGTFARLPPQEASETLSELVDDLQRLLAEHERDDEHKLYPMLASRLQGEEPLLPLSYGHREIFRLLLLLARMRDDLHRDSSAIPLEEVQSLLIRLDTLVRLHFDQEEELYRCLDRR
ncbi:heavy metal translocating P-type ATPase [Metapseudomonas lalkuanensis]|uniref:heavy metal translocating P-type ATPase n=1 Tax=Metapseudomonas lalkuanensis TaxID=2604832 RepID=UPI001CF25179|nr:heavy metal translocating P-type ATPase [Pseudomonas lalkuanensis]UCP00793.1 heavy metal translocating P-type ATPase [Pseudomonas lalkuanensis]